jgi:hypothetical protein
MKVKSDWILEQERNTRTRAIVYFVVAVTLIAGVIGLHSLSLGAPSMVPDLSKQDIRDLNGKVRYQAEGVVREGR